MGEKKDTISRAYVYVNHYASHERFCIFVIFTLVLSLNVMVSLNFTLKGTPRRCIALPNRIWIDSKICWEYRTVNSFMISLLSCVRLGYYIQQVGGIYISEPIFFSFFQ